MNKTQRGGILNSRYLGEQTEWRNRNQGSSHELHGNQSFV